MSEVTVNSARLSVGGQFSISFQRTRLVAPDLYGEPPPPSWGALPIHPLPPSSDQFPQLAADEQRFFIPVGDGEAVWLGFGSHWPPRALRVGVGGRDAVTGARWAPGLSLTPQDYLVCPPQLSLEGLRAADGSVRQFVRRADVGDAGREVNLITLIVYEPKIGRLAETPPPRPAAESKFLHSRPGGHVSGDQTSTLGWRIEHEVCPDPYGVDVWDTAHGVSLSVYMLGHEEYRIITGREPPPRPAPTNVYGGRRLP